MTHEILQRKNRLNLSERIDLKVSGAFEKHMDFLNHSLGERNTL